MAKSSIEAGHPTAKVAEHAAKAAEAAEGLSKDAAKAVGSAATKVAIKRGQESFEEAKAAAGAAKALKRASLQLTSQHCHMQSLQ